jgi:starvation-inducible DNA-binding protein
MYKSQLDLAPDVRRQSRAVLQGRLSDALDMEAQLKQAHWNVRGRDFFQLHKLFDELHGEIEELVDVIAERLTAIGGVADGRVQMTVRATSLSEYPSDAVLGDAHLKAIARALGELGATTRRDIDAATGFGDADTADVFTQVSRTVDKQLWFVEAHLADGGGA